MKLNRNFLRFTFYSLIGVLALLILLILINSIKGEQTPVNYQADVNSKGIRFTFYNIEKNKKLFEFRAAEEYLVPDSPRERTNMKDIYVKIFKKGDLDEELTFTADSGYRERSDNDFYFEENCKISAKDLLITGQDFYMINKNRIKTEKPTKLKIKTLDGIAEQGLEYNIKRDFIRLNEFQGELSQDGKVYQISAQSILIRKGKEHKLSLQGKVNIIEKEGYIRAQVVTLFFYDNFKTPRMIRAKGDSQILRNSMTNGKGEKIYSQGEEQVLKYNTRGELNRLGISEKAQIHLEDNHNNTKISCSIANINFNVKTGQTEEINLRRNSKVINLGRKNFDLTANKIDIFYSDSGEVSYCNGLGDCHFVLEDFTSTSDILKYNIPKNYFLISTKEDSDQDRTASLQNKSNNFTSKSFKVDTQTKTLNSNEGIESVFQFEKENLLFKTENVFIFSKSISINNEKNELTYQGDVKVVQENTTFKAEEVIISNNSKIVAKKDIHIEFFEGEKTTELSGNDLVFDLNKNNLLLRSSAKLKQDENTLSADEIFIKINDSNQISHIESKDPKKVLFKKDKIIGESEQLVWLYDLSQVKFIKNAKIIKNEIETKGKEILLNLKTNDIKILSLDEDRTKTIIDN